MAAWAVYFHPDAEAELTKIPATERAAVLNAVEKLCAIGPNLGYPHSSGVRGVDEELRELRPRQGRSPWRALYRNFAQTSVVAAIGPEATKDRRGFDCAVAIAIERLSAVEDVLDKVENDDEAGDRDE